MSNTQINSNISKKTKIIAKLNSGSPGKSAYQTWLDLGNTGTPQDFLDEIGADKNFVHNQITPQSQWNITHNLNKFPSVVVVDSGNTVVIGNVEYLDKDSIQITFSAGFSGKAYIN